MRVLIFAAHYPVSAARCMLDAFRRIGVDARSVGPAFGTRVWKMELPAETAWTPDGDPEASWPDWRPDLVLVMDLRPFHHPGAYADVPHAVYAVDNHVRDFKQAGIAHYFLAHRHGPAMPVDGSADRTWLPCGYDPALFTPSAIPWRQRKFDVVLIGNLYRQRQMVLEAIGKIDGVRVCAGVGAVYQAYRDIYHDARISLNVSARGDVAMRIFETAAMGCVVLSDPLADLADLRADGVVTYESVDEAVEKTGELLTDPARAEDLAQRAAAWAKPHSWDARAAFIREWCSKNLGVRE